MLLTEWATWHLSVLYWVSPSSVGDYSALLAVTVNRQPGKSYSNIRLTTVQYGFVSLGICGLMLTVWSKKTNKKKPVCCVRNSKVYGFIGFFLFLQCECRWACVLISVICILLTFLHVKHGCILTINLPYRSSFFTSTSDFWKITRWNLLSFPFLHAIKPFTVSFSGEDNEEEFIFITWKWQNKGHIKPQSVLVGWKIHTCYKMSKKSEI